MRIKITIPVLFFISISFALFVGGGGYGFGADYHSVYFNNNLTWGDYRNQLGWLLSTLTIYDTHIGVHLASYLLAMSTGLLLYRTIYCYFEKNSWIFFLLFIFMIHTWPIIMSTSNAMRQGFAMSFIFFAFNFILSRRTTWAIFMALLAVFLHKSGVLLISIFVGLIFFLNLSKRLRLSSYYRDNLLLMTGLILLIFAYLLIPLFFVDKEASRIISGDFRYPFLIINIIFIFIYIKYLKKRADFIDMFLLLTSFIFPVFLFQGFNWEYERLNMMILIPYMISFSRIFILRDKNIVLFSSTVLLLIMTIYTGMYRSLMYF
jgi:hypothetical protein